MGNMRWYIERDHGIDDDDDDEIFDRRGLNESRPAPKISDDVLLSSPGLSSTFWFSDEKHQYELDFEGSFG